MAEVSDHVGKVERIQAFLVENAWVDVPSPEAVTFLAAGEYNENWLVRTDDRDYVLRINHGSQIGLRGGEQIEYEYGVLRALEDSGVTPRPFFLDREPRQLDGGTLLMEYLPGEPLDYRRDWRKAARVFARVHACQPGEGMLVQADPVRDIANECHGLLRRFPDHPLQRERDRLLAYHDEVSRLAEETADLFASEPLVPVNTEVNSHNFIVHAERAWLVDWEKAVTSSRYQDLGHFLVPTTTRWKTDFVFSSEWRRDFVAAYLHEAEVDEDLETALAKCDVMERTILLRALSWCHMAYFEYTGGGRNLRNDVTFDRITEYLENMEDILARG
ncbi:aminoglycoside phosphotransferase family protein [Desulfohalovibrio reitneri]|uniref:aminoglycoside phosphotransferase family protein n=1 Tax=Desulfohalovibrio reitneri TaxID=1307759 RepID=UPI0004A71449|nr:aminoglycoside phosphotransferase family protein [Desulfohalovibrio reitneri]